MAAATHKPRSAWENRFKTPTADQLVSALETQPAGILKNVREALAAIPGASEKVEWAGVWNWCFVWRIVEGSDPAWVYIVPDPAKLRVSIPVADCVVEHLPLRKLSRYGREGISTSPLVGETRWPLWEVTAKTQAEELALLAAALAQPRDNGK